MQVCNRTALVVMARYPTTGHVKTRLATAIGAEAACRLYTAFLQDLDARFCGRDTLDLVWCFSPADADFPGLFARPRRTLPQRGTDLAQRMYHAFADLFGLGYETVVMVGADMPHLAEDACETAVAALGQGADIVLGPSADGGYYLVAMRHMHDIFTAVPMGTNAVLAATKEKISTQHLSLRLLATSFDIDELADLGRLRAMLDDEEWRIRLPLTHCLLDGVLGSV